MESRQSGSCHKAGNYTQCTDHPARQHGSQSMAAVAGSCRQGSLAAVNPAACPKQAHAPQPGHLLGCVDGACGIAPAKAPGEMACC